SGRAPPPPGRSSSLSSQQPRREHLVERLDLLPPELRVVLLAAALVQALEGAHPGYRGRPELAGAVHLGLGGQTGRPGEDDCGRGVVALGASGDELLVRQWPVVRGDRYVVVEPPV